MLTIEIPICDFLQQEEFKSIRLLSGHNNIHRHITATACLDCPTGINYLRGNELILTSGYILYDDPELQMHIVEECNRVGIGALGIDETFFRYGNPAKLLEHARDLQVTVFELPETFSFVTIDRFFAQHFYSKLTHEVCKKNEVILEFNKTFEQSGFSGVVQLLHKWTGCSASIYSHSAMLNYSYPTSLFSVEDINFVNNTDQICIEISLPASDGMDIKVLASDLQHGRGDGRLCIYNPPNGTFSADSTELLSIATGICIHELNHSRDIMSLKREQIHQLMQDILRGVCSEEHAVDIAQTYGYRLKGNYCLAILEVEKIIDESTLSSLLRYFFKENIMITALHSLKYSILIPSTRIKPGNTSMMHILDTHLKTNSYTIAFSESVPFEEISQAHQMAGYILRVGKVLHPQKHFLHPEDIGIHMIFDPYTRGSIYTKLIKKYIRPLLEYNNGEYNLLTTLSTYFDMQLNNTRAANVLYIHSNTVRYRLSLIERILNVDLSKRKDRYLLETALFLYETELHL